MGTWERVGLVVWWCAAVSGKGGCGGAAFGKTSPNPILLYGAVRRLAELRAMCGAVEGRCELCAALFQNLPRTQATWTVTA